MGIPLFYFFVTFIALLTYIAFIRKQRHPNYPPGPQGLPLLGNIVQLGKCASHQLAIWKRKYGDIFSIKFGLDDAIIISDPTLIRELFHDIASSGRCQNPIFLSASGNHGIVNIDGPQWEELRRFVLRKLRDMGFAKSLMEGMILQEAEAIVEWFSKHKDEPILGNRIFNAPVVNSLWNVISGEREPWEESTSESNSGIMHKSFNMIDAFQNTVSTGLIFAPFLRFVAPKLMGWTNLMEAANDINDFFKASISRHLAKLDKNDPQDLIDHVLLQIRETTDPQSSFYKERGEKNLSATIIELFVAGSETTSTTLSWMLLYLVHHPNAQRKMIDEINTVVGQSRSPSLSDKPMLPYTDAVIHEVLRYSALVPTGMFHRMMEDRDFHGYHLPKNTIIIGNLHSALTDPDIWGDSDNFRPERFLSDDGSHVVRHNAFLPFSTGKRHCLGQGLAMDTLFLFTACIFQKFKVLPDPDNPKPDFFPESGFISFPKPFKVVMKEHVPLAESEF